MRHVPEIPTSTNPLVLVNEMTLLFHGPIWDEFQKNAWNKRLEALYKPHGRGVPNYEATNKTLCEAIRVALDQHDRQISQHPLDLE